MLNRLLVRRLHTQFVAAKTDEIRAVPLVFCQDYDNNRQLIKVSPFPLSYSLASLRKRYSLILRLKALNLP